MKEKISAYIELTKPRITMLVLVTVYLGYYLGLRSQCNHMTSLDSWLILFYLLLGTWATSASAAVLNQVMEKLQDAKMSRTQHRPIVRGVVQRMPAFIFGIILGIFGFIFLYHLTNPCVVVGGCKIIILS